MKQDNKGSGAGFLSRRKVLGMMGASAAASLVNDLKAQPSAPPGAVSPPNCIVRPQQTEGPYYLRKQLQRADIRSDPGTGELRPGLPLRLEFRVAAITRGQCSPLNGAMVEVWQNDAMGEYSDVQDPRYDNRGLEFLRGYQQVDESGQTSFLTIYPGWYPSRTVHIHFKVRTEPDAEQGREFTSQLYFDDAITDQVHGQAPYASNGQRSRRNEDDFIFRRGGRELMLQLDEDDAGMIGRFEIGLEL